MFLRILGFFVVVLSLLFIITPLVIPVVKKTRWFPFFRDPEGELKRDLALAAEELDRTKLKEEISHIEEETKKIAARFQSPDVNGRK